MIYLFDVICSSVVCWHPPAVLCPSPRDGESQPGICGMVVRINILFKGFYSQLPVSTTCLRGFNKFWRKWVVQHNRQVLFWKAFLSRGVRGHAPPPREILKSYTLAGAFSCNLRSIFILLCCP